MKKVISLLLMLSLVLSLCIGLISCGGNETPDNNQDNNNPNGNDPEASTRLNMDLTGYVANIGNATALGISRQKKNGASPVASLETGKSDIKPLSYTVTFPPNYDDIDRENRNYIVMSTTEYGSNVETNENGIVNVTFTKIVTENATTEISGTKRVCYKTVGRGKSKIRTGGSRTE